MRRSASSTTLWATVGSSNIDPFSLLLAREANLVVRDEPFARELRERLEEAIANESAPVHADASPQGRPRHAPDARGRRTPRCGSRSRCPASPASTDGRAARAGASAQVATTSSCCGRRACTARRATSTSTRGGRSIAPSSRMRTATTRGSATGTTSRPRRAKACCARGSARSTCRRSRTARRSTTTASACRCIRPGTCSAPRRSASNTADACGSRRATTSSWRDRRPADVDPTCPPFEPVRCDVFITESTFGLPIYRWQPQREIFAGIDAWWRAQRRGRPCVGAVLLRVRQGAAGPRRHRRAHRPDLLPRRGRAAEPRVSRGRRRAAADDAGLGGHRQDRCSARARARAAVGRRARRGCGASANTATRSRRAGCCCAARGGGAALDRGFVLSDHADWPGLHAAIAATGAERVIVTHGQVPVMVRWLVRERTRRRSVRDRIRRRGATGASRRPPRINASTGRCERAVARDSAGRPRRLASSGASAPCAVPSTRAGRAPVVASGWIRLDRVAPAVLRRVHRRVGRGEQLTRRVDVARLGDADADRHVDRHGSIAALQ